MTVPSKEWFQRQGIPAGVGAVTPPQPTSEDITEAVRDQELEENAVNHSVADAFSADDEYQVQTPNLDRSKFLTQTTVLVPFTKSYYRDPYTKKVKEKIVGGDIPEDQFERNYGIINKVLSNTYYTEDDIRLMRHKIKRASISVLWCLKGKGLTAEEINKMDQLEILALSKLGQGRNGFIVKESNMSRTESDRVVGVERPRIREGFLRRISSAWSKK